MIQEVEVYGFSHSYTTNLLASRKKALTECLSCTRRFSCILYGLIYSLQKLYRGYVITVFHSRGYWVSKRVGNKLKVTQNDLRMRDSSPGLRSEYIVFELCCAVFWARGPLLVENTEVV